MDEIDAKHRHREQREGKTFVDGIRLKIVDRYVFTVRDNTHYNTSMWDCLFGGSKGEEKTSHLSPISVSIEEWRGQTCLCIGSESDVGPRTKGEKGMRRE